MANATKSIRHRVFGLTALLSLIWVLIVARLFSIQVINGQKYKAKCKRQADYRKVIAPLRGIIFDRNKKPLTIDVVQISFSAHPNLITDKLSLAKEISSWLGNNNEKYLNTLQSDRTFVWLERNIPQDQIHTLLDENKNYPGLIIDRNIHRQYPFGEIGGQLIGFTDVDNRGISGLELEFDPYLSGEPGWKIIQKDGLGRLNNRPDLPFKETIDGNDVILTIDHEYQTILHEELNSAFFEHNADKAMGIIIDPKSGEILAMASAPLFNPNKPFNYPVSSQKNRVTADIFEPGSTFKIVTATAALEENHVHPEDSIHCEKGFIKIGKNIISDHKKYNTLTFSEIIKKSSNVGTITVAQKIGKDYIFKYARKYGFGVKTGIQFPGESNGIVHPLKEWNDLMLAQVAIGHGLCCTALQLAYAYSAIANGGFLLKPQIVKSIQTKDGIVLYKGKPQYIRRVASVETMTTMRELVRLTVQSGTGSRADVHGMAIAGKTGTAQKVIKNGYSHTDYVATFVGFFPVNNPKLLCVIVIDNPKGKTHTGGEVSAPVVKEVFTRIVNQSDEIFLKEDNIQRPITKYAKIDEITTTRINSIRTKRAEVPNPLLSSLQYTSRMPNLYGKTSSEAIGILQRMGMSIGIKGSGLVVSQTPSIGSLVTSNTQCQLILKPPRLSVE